MSEKKLIWIKPVAKIYKKENIIYGGPTNSLAETGFTNPPSS